MRRIVCLTVLVVSAFAGSARAQTFTSGSTGADGALSPPEVGGSVVWVQLPESGVLHYTTVIIPPGVTVRFRKNSQNTPVSILATGDITVAGAIDVSAGIDAFQRVDLVSGGPGGFDGARVDGQPGLGPGGGAPGQPGRWVGPASLVPPVGGSGGGGPGGGGGGILLASSSSIRVSGAIGATGSHCGHWTCSAISGSGGAIRLVANTVIVSGHLNAYGYPNHGLIRIEAPEGGLPLPGSFNSHPEPVMSAVNPALLTTAVPTLTIASIGGYPVPTYAGARFSAADVVLPTQLPDPIPIVVHATNIPVGTAVTATIGRGNGSATITPGTLSGTLASASAVVDVSGLSRDGSISYLYVTTMFAVPSSAGLLNPPGPNHVSHVLVSAAPGRASTTTLLRANGTVVNPADVSPALRELFR